MKYLLLCILILTVRSVTAQEVAGHSILRVKRQAEKLQVYTDSINNYSSGPLPAFLFDECFDWHNGFCWDGPHSPRCGRCEIIEKVTNLTALKKIWLQQDKRLAIKCVFKQRETGYFKVIPRIEESFADLILKRYEDLLTEEKSSDTVLIKQRTKQL